MEPWETPLYGKTQTPWLLPWYMTFTIYYGFSHWIPYYALDSRCWETGLTRASGSAWGEGQDDRRSKHKYKCENKHKYKYKCKKKYKYKCWAQLCRGEAWEPRSDERVEMIGSGRSVGRVYQFIIDFLSLGCTAQMEYTGEIQQRSYLCKMIITRPR